MRTLIFALLLTALNCFGAPLPNLWLNAWSTNRSVLPVFGDNNLAVSNRVAGAGGGTAWNFYGISPNTVARLKDATNIANAAIASSNANYVLKFNGGSDGQIATNLTIPESGAAQLFALSPTGLVSRATVVFTNGLIMAESPNNFIGLGDLNFAVDFLGTFPYGNDNTSLRFYQVSTNVQDCEFKWESYSMTNDVHDRSRVWFWSDTRTQGRIDTWMQLDAQGLSNPNHVVGFNSTVEFNSRMDPNDATNGSYSYISVNSRSDGDLRRASVVIRPSIGDNGGTAFGNQSSLIEADINGVLGIDFIRFRTNGGDMFRVFRDGSVLASGIITNTSLSPSKFVSTGTGTQLVSSVYSDADIAALQAATNSLQTQLTAATNGFTGTNGQLYGATNTVSVSNQVPLNVNGLTGQNTNLANFSTNGVSTKTVVDYRGFVGVNTNVPACPLTVSGNQTNFGNIRCSLDLSAGAYVYCGNGNGFFCGTRAGMESPDSTNIRLVNNAETIACAMTTSNVFLAGLLSATNSVATFRSNLLAPTAITFPNSTVNWTNPLNCNIELYIDNTAVTGTAIKKNGTQIFGGLSNDVTMHLQPGEFFSETYSVGTPSATFSPF